MDQQQGMNKTYMTIGGIIILALAIWGIYALTHQNNNTASNTNQQLTQDNGANAAANADATTTAVVGTTAAGSATKAYEAALLKYKTARIQFTGCQATPHNMTLKNPATIMLDNRSSATNKLVLDGKTYSLPALGYQIVTLNETVLPARSFIDCNSSQNVALLLIEK